MSTFEDEELRRMVRALFAATREVEEEHRLEAMATAPPPFARPSWWHRLIYRAEVHVAIGLAQLLVLAGLLWRLW